MRVKFPDECSCDKNEKNRAIEGILAEADDRFVILDEHGDIKGEGSTEAAYIPVDSLND